MITEIKKTIRVTGNLSRHLVPLCVLLFAGCMDDDFFIPEGDDYVYDDPYSYDDFLKQEKFPPKSVYHPPYNRRTGPYDPNPPSRSWNPNDEPYNQPTHSNGRQGDNHRYRWSDHKAESIRTTTHNVASRNESNNHMSPEVLQEGCKICCDTDAYQDNKPAVQCLKCKQFICEPCHTQIKEAANNPHLHTYHAGGGGLEFRCRTRFVCPYCKSPYE